MVVVVYGYGKCAGVCVIFTKFRHVLAVLVCVGRFVLARLYRATGEYYGLIYKCGRLDAGNLSRVVAVVVLVNISVRARGFSPRR